MTLRIEANKVKGADLNAGDLFSTANQDYWDKVNRNDEKTIGEKVYIRTSEPCPENQKHQEIYRLTVYHY